MGADSYRQGSRPQDRAAEASLPSHFLLSLFSSEFPQTVDLNTAFHCATKTSILRNSSSVDVEVSSEQQQSQ